MRVLLYSKAGCHLCEVVDLELVDLQRELGFVYERRQLQEGDDLFAQFAHYFPVVDIEPTAAAPPAERIRLMAPIDRRQLRAQIRQAVGAGAPARTA